MARASTGSLISGGRFRSIRFRIVAAFLAALIAMMSAQGFLIFQQREVGRSLSLISDGYLRLAMVVALLDEDRKRVEKDVERLLAGQVRPLVGSDSTTLIYSEQLRRKIAFGRTQAIHVRDTVADSAQEKAIFDGIVSELDLIDVLFRQYQIDSSKLVSLAEGGQLDEAEELRKPLIDNGALLADEIDKLGRNLDRRIDDLTARTEEAQSRTAVVAGVLTTLALIFSIVLIVAVQYALRPVGTLTTEVQRLAAGDYGRRIEVRGNDEIAILASEFNNMVQALQLRDRTLVERAEELNRLSAYLGNVLDSLEDALLVVEDGRVTLTNPASERVWEASRGDAAPAALASAMAEPGRHEIRGPDDTLQEVRVVEFGDSGTIAIVADITEQTQAQERLARSERLALVGHMLAQITHEVRNPLNALSLNAELLADELGQLDPERKTEGWELLAIVANEIERLTAVTGHYLQLARRPPAQLVAEDIGALIRDVNRLLEPELATKGVTMAIDTASVPPQLIDGMQLRQALLNVVRNALESGAQELTLTLSETADEVLLALRDDGPGLGPEEIERSTDPFYSTKATGTGLGLAITKQILEDHDGTVRVTSTLGEGATVTLVLPRRPAELEALETAHVADHPGR